MTTSLAFGTRDRVRAPRTISHTPNTASLTGMARVFRYVG